MKISFSIQSIIFILAVIQGVATREVHGSSSRHKCPFRKIESSWLASQYPSYYDSAHGFAVLYGIPFSEFVISKIKANQKTTILISLGGAEHLGTLLEAYISAKGIKDIEIKYVYLTEKIIGPWKVIIDNAIEGNTIRVGIGPKPKKYLMDLKGGGEPGNNSIEQISEYLSQREAFKNPKLLVVDTGFFGTMPEAVATVAKRRNFRGEIEGLLLAHAPPVQHTIPVTGFNEYFKGVSPKDLDDWVYLIDSGLLRAEAKLLDEQNAKIEYAFRKSRPSPSKLIKGFAGKYYPDTPKYSDELLINQFNATVLGIREGIREALNATSKKVK